MLTNNCEFKVRIFCDLENIKSSTSFVDIHVAILWIGEVKEWYEGYELNYIKIRTKCMNNYYTIYLLSTAVESRYSIIDKSEIDTDIVNSMLNTLINTLLNINENNIINEIEKYYENVISAYENVAHILIKTLLKELLILEFGDIITLIIDRIFTGYYFKHKNTKDNKHTKRKLKEETKISPKHKKTFNKLNKQIEKLMSIKTKQKEKGKKLTKKQSENLNRFRANIRHYRKLYKLPNTIKRL